MTRPQRVKHQYDPQPKVEDVIVQEEEKTMSVTVGPADPIEISEKKEEE